MCSLLVFLFSPHFFGGYILLVHIIPPIAIFINSLFKLLKKDLVVKKKDIFIHVVAISGTVRFFVYIQISI